MPISNAEEFYLRRDDRTDRIAENHDYQQLHVRVIADPTIVKTYTGQVQLLLTANMLSRWCRTIEFGFVDDILMPQLQLLPGMTLHQRIADEIQAADPFGKFEFQLYRSDLVQYTLRIGNTPSHEPVNFTVDSDGWVIYAGQQVCPFKFHYSLHNPVGPALAACIGVADAFKVATKQPINKRVKKIIFSAFDFRNENTYCHQPIVKQLSLGNAHIIGIGSVGSAVIYLLRMMSVNGKLTLIDHDIVKVENLNRSPLFGIGDVGSPKVKVAQQYLNSQIPIHVFKGTYNDFITQNGRLPQGIDIILPLANEFGVRAAIENNFPPLQIYGTTLEWGINYHHHIPFFDDCSFCRFPEDSAVPTICSTATIKGESDEQVDAALPFASIGAAALTIGGLIRFQSLDYLPGPNFAWIDFKGDLSHILNYRRQPQSQCLCGKRSNSVYTHFIRETQFYPFSTTN